MIKINLLAVERERTKRKASFLSMGGQKVTAGCSLILVAAALFVGWWYWSLQRDSADLDQQIVDAERETISRLAEIDNVRAVKQAKPSIDAARHVVACGLDLYAGDDDLILPFLEVGGVGGICVHTHVVGPQVKELIASFRSGDVERAHALDEEQRQACYAESTELAHELSAAGQFLGSAPLHPTAAATSVRVREGKRLVTDGPFAETREQLGGFYLIEARDLDEAIGVAARIPMARRGTVEVRPVIDLPGLPTGR